ncbi:MAG: hypothetical protein KKD28_10700 [Chloroflexi bacterium]|nr:hypothetical protein [Chloroflexota bacterium]
MAKVKGNLMMARLSGSLGDQFIVKRGRGGRTIVCKKPTFQEDREFSPAQLARQQAFREAAAYARTQKGNPVYIEKAEGTAKCSYNVAIADYLHPPQILEINLSGWVNGDGGTIRVRAQDDVRVEGVKVTISDETGAFLEEGQATEMGALWWEYSTAHAAANNMHVTVSAKDLPGHVTERTELKGHPKVA